MQMSDASSPAKIRSHRDLIAWQKAMVLVTDVYDLTKTFPREETYGLTAQIRRAAASVPPILPKVKVAVTDASSSILGTLEVHSWNSILISSWLYAWVM